MEVEAPVPAHSVPSASTPSYSPARFVPAVTTPAVVDPMHPTGSAAMDQVEPAPVSPDAEAEAKLTVEIAKLWGLQKDSKTAVQRTRAELKVLRLELGEKLHSMKAILVRTGRGGGWASYLRSQELPPTSADRYVAAHQATLTPPTKNAPTGDLSDPTADEVRHAGEKLLPRLRQMLKTPQSVVWFVQEVIMQLPAADGRRTKAGYEVLVPTPQDELASQQQHSTSSTPPRTVPQRSSLALLYSQVPR